MNTRTQIRHIPCGSASDINLNNDLLLVCGLHSTSKYFEKGLGHRFWKLSELMDFPARKLDLTRIETLAFERSDVCEVLSFRY